MLSPFGLDGWIFTHAEYENGWNTAPAVLFSATGRFRL